MQEPQHQRHDNDLIDICYNRFLLIFIILIIIHPAQPSDQ
jgi:hypothetical protein